MFIKLKREKSCITLLTVQTPASTLMTAAANKD
jgi:hypothetical protein